jgi:hypothetical protein
VVALPFSGKGVGGRTWDVGNKQKAARRRVLNEAVKTVLAYRQQSLFLHVLPIMK